jgi:O-succinylbenzoate synthase
MGIVLYFSDGSLKIYIYRHAKIEECGRDFMNYSLQYKVYRRPFQNALETARGPWRIREGIVLRLKDAQEKVGFGEVAPIEDFGTESLADAEAFLKSLKGTWDGKIPGKLPCSAFGLGCAEGWINDRFSTITATLETAALLPAGERAVAVMDEKLAAGFRTFKWKMGVGDPDSEKKIAATLAGRGTLRLDANGGLDIKQTKDWLGFLDTLPGVEYLEQPLPRGRWRECFPLNGQFKTPIALDEDASEAHDWPGPLVIKPALAGNIPATTNMDSIYSSALETSIGKEAALRLAMYCTRAIGFGVRELFPEDGLDLHDAGPRINVGTIGTPEMKEIWERI